MDLSQIHFHLYKVTIQQQQIILLTLSLNSNKDNFRTLSSQALFENIVKNLYPDYNKAYYF